MPSPAHETRRRARSAARLAAVQALYQMEISGAGLAQVQREFEDHRIGAAVGDGEDDPHYHEADLEHFRAILKGVVADQSAIDKLTDKALVARWPLGRIDATLRALFRAAGHELTARADVPAKVAIQEYVDVAAAFFDGGQEARFVNAVLDHMAREARPGELAPR